MMQATQIHTTAHVVAKMEALHEGQVVRFSAVAPGLGDDAIIVLDVVTANPGSGGDALDNWLEGNVLTLHIEGENYDTSFPEDLSARSVVAASWNAHDIAEGLDVWTTAVIGRDDITFTCDPGFADAMLARDAMLTSYASVIEPA